MMFAVIKTGGKQYLVKKDDELYVDNLGLEQGKKTDVDMLAMFDTETKKVELGKPVLDKKVKIEVLENLKGDKIRVARFKSKVRYRKVRGYRHSLSKIKVVKI